MQAAERAFEAISREVRFFIKQDRVWKVIAVRTKSTMFFYLLVLPYLSIYTMALRATGTQLGIVNSIGMGIASIVGS